jgi:signal transduction histidine kinase
MTATWTAPSVCFGVSLPEYAGPKRLRELLGAVMAVASDLDLSTVLRRIVELAAELVEARYAALGVLDESGQSLSEFITVGLTVDEISAIGALPKGHGILGLLIVEPRPIRLPVLQEHADSYGFPPNHPPMRSFLGVPITVRGHVFGNLYLTDKTTAEAFSDVDEELVVTLASAAAIAIDNARLHARISELVVLEDRERIARDLHDTVIQRLFAVGLSLQGTARLAQRPEVRDRIEEAVEDLDRTVREIRTAIFGLERGRTGRAPGVRDQVLSLVREASGALGFQPHVAFEGAIDATVAALVGEDLVATLREALANVARHAGASTVEVTVAVDGDLLLRVADDGRGIPSGRTRKGHGLRNMATRAEQLGGSFSVSQRDGTGTVLEWRVPVH